VKLNTKVPIILMTCKGREKYRDYLVSKIPNLIVIQDNDKAAMEAYFNVLRAAGTGAYIHLEDDILLTTNFEAKIKKVIAEHRSEVINFFSRRGDDLTIGSRHVSGGSYNYNCCVYFPKGYAAAILKYSDTWWPANKQKNPTGLDTIIADFLKQNKLGYWNQVPSLVQHRDGVSAINPRRPNLRISKTFKE